MDPTTTDWKFCKRLTTPRRKKRRRNSRFTDPGRNKNTKRTRITNLNPRRPTAPIYNTPPTVTVKVTILIKTSPLVDHQSPFPVETREDLNADSKGTAQG